MTTRWATRARRALGLTVNVIMFSVGLSMVVALVERAVTAETAAGIVIPALVALVVGWLLVRVAVSLRRSRRSRISGSSAARV